MKEYDRVKLIKDRLDYAKAGVKAGDKGVILGPKRLGYFLVVFDGEIYQNKDGVYCTTEKNAGILEEDLEVIED